MAQRRLRCLWGLVMVVVACVALVQGDVWAKWGDRAHLICTTMLNKKSSAPSFSYAMCDNLQDVVEEAIADLTYKMSSALNLDFTTFRDDMVSRASKSPYRATGERIIKGTVKWVVENNIKSEKEIRDHFHTKFAQWIMDMAVDNKSAKQMPPIPTDNPEVVEQLRAMGVDIPEQEEGGATEEVGDEEDFWTKVDI
ncbi:hypothetical protein QOT17_020344 [Balamuthia mandrillaris]